jgi:hypothetical protein
MVRSLTVHEAHNNSVGMPSHFARCAALAANLSENELKKSMAVHRAANRAKHDWPSEPDPWSCSDPWSKAAAALVKPNFQTAAAVESRSSIDFIKHDQKPAAAAESLVVRHQYQKPIVAVESPEAQVQFQEPIAALEPLEVSKQIALQLAQFAAAVELLIKPLVSSIDAMKLEFCEVKNIMAMVVAPIAVPPSRQEGHHPAVNSFHMDLIAKDSAAKLGLLRAANSGLFLKVEAHHDATIAAAATLMASCAAAAAVESRLAHLAVLNARLFDKIEFAAAKLVEVKPAISAAIEVMPAIEVKPTIITATSPFVLPAGRRKFFAARAQPSAPVEVLAGGALPRLAAVKVFNRFAALSVEADVPSEPQVPLVALQTKRKHSAAFAPKVQRVVPPHSIMPIPAPAVEEIRCVQCDISCRPEYFYDIYLDEAHCPRCHGQCTYECMFCCDNIFI